MSRQILIIDDEAEIRKYLCVTLQSAGLACLAAENGKDGLLLFNEMQPDALLLDLGLPDMTGLEVLQSIRRESQVPVIVLSASDQETAKLAAIEAGANDYLIKPYNARELISRLQTAMRHHGAESFFAGQYEEGGLKVDCDGNSAWLDGEALHLKEDDFHLLCLLINHAGKILTHPFLIRQLWGEESLARQTELKMRVQKLRQSLNDDPLQPRFILTEPGLGYRFEPSPAVCAA